MKQTKNSTVAKRISVSFESQQETAIMALLAYFGVKFGVNAPRKSCENCQFFDIEIVEINGTQFDFKAFIEHYIVANNKQLSPETAHYGKYQKRNMTAATNNILIEMLRAIGWKISFKNSKEAKITVKMERINVLSFGGVVINGEDIALFGEQLNMGLKSVVSLKKSDAPLMIGNEELPIHVLCDLSSISNSIDLSPIVKMLQPINVSQQIGNNICCQNDIQMNDILNTHYTNENEERRNDVQQYIVDCSKIVDGQNQSQFASNSISGTIANSEISANHYMCWNNAMMYGQGSPCAYDAPLAAAARLAAHGADNKDELRRERMSEMNTNTIHTTVNNNSFTKFDDKKDFNEKYANELPPATNAEDTLQMQHNEINMQQMNIMQTQSPSPVNSNVPVVVDSVIGDDGNIYLLTYIPYYGWCYCPTVQSVHSVHHTPSQNTMNMNVNMNMNNAMVEGVEKGEGEEEDCVFMQMVNYSNAV